MKVEGLENILRLTHTRKVFDEEVTDGLNDFGLEWRDDTRANVDVDTGNLRSSVFFDGVKKWGGSYKVTVGSNVDYASPYEYGHRQEVGRYVPALGKRLVQPYVKGSYVFTKSFQRMEKTLTDTLEEAGERACRRLSGD